MMAAVIEIINYGGGRMRDARRIMSIRGIADERKDFPKWIG